MKIFIEKKKAFPGTGGPFRFKTNGPFSAGSGDRYTFSNDLAFDDGHRIWTDLNRIEGMGSNLVNAGEEGLVFLEGKLRRVIWSVENNGSWKKDNFSGAEKICLSLIFAALKEGPGWRNW